MKLEVTDLRKMFEMLAEHLEETGQASVEIPWDFYWEVSREERYDPYSEPKQFGLGQLSDDWNELLKIRDGEMPSVGYALVWLSSILRSVGEAAKL